MDAMRPRPKESVLTCNLWMYHCTTKTDRDDTMKIQIFLESAAAALLVASSAEAFASGGGSSRSTTPNSQTSQLRAEIGESGVAFEHVAREWRCKVRV